MIWGETLNEWHERVTNWGRWFAWHPVKITHGNDRGRWVWLETIERKIHFLPGWGVALGPRQDYRMLQSSPEQPPPTETPTP